MYFCNWIIMSNTKNTALILGANGLIGAEILYCLLQNDNFSKIYTVTRKELPYTNDKLIQIIADANTIDKKLSNIDVDKLYCCIGTTKNKVANNTEYYKIDHDYPIKVAKILQKQGCQSISIVSSIGADIKSNSFYLKLKGEVEKSIIDLDFDSTFIYRPSLLMGDRKEKRVFEGIAKALSPLLDFYMIGKLENYRSIQASTVAKAMINNSLSNNLGTHIYQTKEIKENA